jgi:hypothetical protein
MLGKERRGPALARRRSVACIGSGDVGSILGAVPDRIKAR